MRQNHMDFCHFVPKIPQPGHLNTTLSWAWLPQFLRSDTKPAYTTDFVAYIAIFDRHPVFIYNYSIRISDDPAGKYDSHCLFEPTDTLNGTKATTLMNVRPPCGLARNGSAIERKTGRSGCDPPRTF